MSIIHWDKSVLTFHAKEILEDHQRGDRTAIFGLGAIIVSTVALPVLAKWGKPVVKSVIKTAINMNPPKQLTSHSLPKLTQHNLQVKQRI